MSALGFSRHALALSAASLLAGCGALPFNSGAAAATQARVRTGLHGMTAYSYRVVHAFKHAREGGRPAGALLDVNGTLYGTTQFGGGGGCSIFGGTGCGTVYRLDPKSGVRKMLYGFRGGADGAYPTGDLIDVNGTLYGTTTYGGGGEGYGFGTVYSITTTGTETVLHSFDHANDAYWPFSGLIDVNGTLYGTTEYGGAGSCDCGTVYTISTSGLENILYTFGDNAKYPAAGLIDVKGTLYGTTLGGGSSGYGTVYSMTTAGTEKVLHSFSSSPDGASPSGGLIDLNGVLYGTTSSGGSTICEEIGPSSCGIVYSITAAGKEKVLYSFVPYNSGGYYPHGGLAAASGTLYGTTAAGGDDPCEGYDSCGIIYSVSTTGSEATLHAFSGGSDGAFPSGAMIDAHGTLYGPTSNGGAPNCKYYAHGPLGCGTIFALTP